MDVVSIGAAKADATRKYTTQKASTIATRIFGGRMSTIDNSSPNTFQITTELAQHFDAVRVLFANTDLLISHAFRLVGVSVMADKTDLNNAAGTWVTANRNGMSRIYAELAPGTGRIAYTATDWIAISSIPRTDGGTNPLLVARAYMNATATLPVYGAGVDNFTNWATRTDGRIWCSRQQPGVQVTSGFTSTTNTNNNPIVGFQYLTKGKVITVAGCGDSITDGRGTYLNEGFILPAIDALSSMSGTAYEYMNCGWSGQAMQTFAERAIDILQSSIKPDVLVLPGASPNDVATTIAQANIDAFKYFRNRVIAEARKVGVPVIAWTWLPSNTAVKNYGATDSLRVAYNAELMAMAGKGLFVADAATPINGTTSGGQIQMGATLTADGIHPNDAGNALIRDVIKPLIQQAGRASADGGKALLHKNDLPVWVTTDTDAYVSKSGRWVYAGTSAASWTIAPASPTPRSGDSGWYWISVRGTAAPLTLGRSNADTFNAGGGSLTSITIQPGQSVLLVPSGGAAWEVHGWQPSLAQSVNVSAAATLTMARDASVYVCSATSGTPTWTLPALANNTGLTYRVKNRGSVSLTVQRAGSDNLYDTTTQTSITVAAGASATIINDGTYWLSL
ncbi:SGNH/GDSL hydrolase family protein [Arthrobacter sp. B2a2-09]|uniref:SGNH/GDSL hydrolase family protein n=1 Tax=Arthrobacter sp. B2a2-09 TaxID=2952822 RepID=UPI0022CD7375|nr:SGNH/GDSL hydrolase family protein [Arthrobacter sp. B2a2-09]MCZ9884045.1 SGNH/GDSL hydrolase family protein [Arthrobacter sp. B2a2-09]